MIWGLVNTTLFNFNSVYFIKPNITNYDFFFLDGLYNLSTNAIPVKGPQITGGTLFEMWPNTRMYILCLLL